ncbi:hypothetical protein [Salibacterium lacus]|uniref:Uncharacterized protein n=1 Tax=Salibacterium lacus TaxID=1898109 RepID=A0ABW5T5M3_9BACI
MSEVESMRHWFHRTDMYNGTSIERLDKMHETEWDIQEVKRSKKLELVQHNLVMLLLFVWFVQYVHNGASASVLLGLCSVLLWITAIPSLYKLKRGKAFGTKSSRIVQNFDRHLKGGKRWKRRTMIEACFIIFISTVFTVLLFVMDVDSVRLDSPIDIFPFIGGWAGFNVVEMIRLNNL